MTGRSDPASTALGRTVLAVFAHPDDEALACGGTLARLAAAGARVVIVCASRGELGSVSDPALVSGGDVGSARVGELAASARVLGAAEVVQLAHPDGTLRWADALDGEIAVLTCFGDAHKPSAAQVGELGCRSSALLPHE